MDQISKFKTICHVLFVFFAVSLSSCAIYIDEGNQASVRLSHPWVLLDVNHDGYVDHWVEHEVWNGIDQQYHAGHYDAFGYVCFEDRLDGDPFGFTQEVCLDLDIMHGVGVSWSAEHHGPHFYRQSAHVHDHHCPWTDGF